MKTTPMGKKTGKKANGKKTGMTIEIQIVPNLTCKIKVKLSQTHPDKKTGTMKRKITLPNLVTGDSSLLLFYGRWN